MKHGEFEQKEAKVTKGNQAGDFSGSGSVVGPGQPNWRAEARADETRRI